MKIGKTIIHAQSVSQIRGFQAFMADKQPHSFCRNGINSRIQIAGISVQSIILDKALNKNAATDESIGGSHSRYREARSPP